MLNLLLFIPGWLSRMWSTRQVSIYFPGRQWLWSVAASAESDRRSSPAPSEEGDICSELSDSFPSSFDLMNSFAASRYLHCLAFRIKSYLSEVFDAKSFFFYFFWYIFNWCISIGFFRNFCNASSSELEFPFEDGICWLVRGGRYCRHRFDSRQPPFKSLGSNVGSIYGIWFHLSIHDFLVWFE